MTTADKKSAVRRMTGAELRAARVRLGMTQEGLAELLGYTRTHLCEMENEQVPVRRIMRWALLGLELSRIVEGRREVG
jgi:DNA-binding XRE family transcriptional regulator